ncbi:MAG TPA: PEGA domain-containing protein [Bryobacteraceae bacterium]|jgi:hypothetical protein
MKRATLCLGILLAFVASIYAQDAPSATPNGSNASLSNASQTNAQTQDHEAMAASGNQNDHQSSGQETHVRLGGFSVSAGYAHFGPGVYPYGFPYGPYYSPIAASLWWDSIWGFYPAGYPAGYFTPADGKGEVKLNDAPKDATVYLNGGYAGTVEHLKSFWLDPGVYDLVLSTPDGREYQQRVYVLTGKTLKIEAKLVKPSTDGERM